MTPTPLSPTPLVNVEAAKKLARAAGGNDSAVQTPEAAGWHIDASSGSGQDQTDARAALDRLKHKHG